MTIRDSQSVNLGKIETSTDTIEAKLTTLDGRVDGLEALIALTNTKLDTTIAAVDGLEALIAATNTKLDTTIAAVDGLEALVALTNTALAAINVLITAGNASLVTIATNTTV